MPWREISLKRHGSCDKLVDNIHSLYFRALTRLCQAAEAVETSLGYTS